MLLQGVYIHSAIHFLKSLRSSFWQILRMSPTILRYFLLSQITEALSRLPETDLEAILAAIANLGRERGVA